MLTEQTMGYVFVFRVQVIKDNICIAGMAGSKNNNLKILW